MLQQRSQFNVIFPNCTGSSLYIIPQLLQGNSDNTEIHSAIWKFFTLVAPKTKNKFATADDWVKILNESREGFYKLKEQYFLQLDEDGDALDPLTAKEDSQWSQFFNDQELRQQIARDTCRTFQEIEFFTKEETLKNLEDILFLFCRTHPDYEYAQGLHEICAVIYYTFYNEMKAEDSDPISCIFNVKSVVPDTYYTFTAVALALKRLYEPTQPGENSSYCASVAEKIQGPLLAKYNQQLANHLQDANISAPTYMVQWLRLLFCRNFDIDGILTMWDLIIAYLPDLQIVEYTALAVILNAQNSLLQADAIGVLQLLFKYPKVPNPARFVVTAAEMLNKNKKPAGAEDIKLAVAERLNDLARSMEKICTENHYDEALPYVMDLRRTRDMLLGILPLDEMIPLEQAVALFKVPTVEMKVVEEKVEKEVKEEQPIKIEMPLAANARAVKTAPNASLLFEDEDVPKKKKKGGIKKVGGGLFD